MNLSPGGALLEVEAGAGHVFHCRNGHPVAFSHAFQPIVHGPTTETFSHEILVRGIMQEGAASVFAQVPADEVAEFDQLSRERAIELAASLGAGTRINLNFSPGSILRGDGRALNQTVAHAQASGIESENLIVEVTEEEAVRDYRRLGRILDEFRAQGVAVAIDDFGAGYAGLRMLMEIQPEYLKLDMQLVKDIHQSGPRQAIVNAVSELCLDLGIDLIAEGVERVDEYEFLANKGVEYFQGYLLARPGFECLPTVSMPCAWPHRNGSTCQAG